MICDRGLGIWGGWEVVIWRREKMGRRESGGFEFGRMLLRCFWELFLGVKVESLKSD